MAIKAALLDVDGTLIDSNEAHAQTWWATLTQFGHRVTMARVRELIGKGADKLLPEAAGIEKESRAGKELTHYRSTLFRVRCVPHLKAFPGARGFLEALGKRRIRPVVATSAAKDELNAVLKATGLSDLLPRATSASDAPRSKPDPDIIKSALRIAECDPSEAVMLGDSPYDVEAALRAGVRIVGVRSGNWSDDDLSGAETIYDDVQDLLNHLDSSPFGEERDWSAKSA